MSNSQTLYILDSYAIAFRSFYAFIQNPLINSRGEQTSLPFGYLNTLLRLINEQSADYLSIVTDLPGPTFRHNLYPLYKANRSEMPAEMQQQIPIFQELIDCSKLSHLSREGYEADDVIGALAIRASAAGWNAQILSKDKDLMQLVDDRVSLIQLERAGRPPSLMTPVEVEEKWGVPPHLVRDLLALMGDSSDNIPGVPGVGPKKGAALLNEWGSLDGVLENIDKISAKALKKNLEESRDILQMSRQLVTLQTDLDIEFIPDDYRLANRIDTEALAYYCQKYELLSLLKPLREAEKRLGKAAAIDLSQQQKAADNLRTITEQSELQELIQALEKATLVAIDTETDSLDSRHAALVGLCIAADNTTGWYLPFGHPSRNLDPRATQQLLEPHLHRKGVRWVMHNAKFDLQVLESNGWRLPEQFDDTMVASWCLNAGERVHSLEEQVFRRLRHQMIPIVDLIGRGKGQQSFDCVDLEKAGPYGAEDALYTYRLWEVLEKELQKEGLNDHYIRDELPLIELLRLMEKRGISIDSEKLKQLSAEIAQQLQREQEAIWHEAGELFNIASPQQLSAILFDKLQLPHGKKTRTGGYSTNAAVLEELRWEHPIVERILNFREWTKLQGTYVDVLPGLVDPTTNRLHTSFNQTVAATGRLSSNNPNLQNIPVRTPLGSRVRAAFVAKSPEHLLLSADYSQIELRVLAHLSNDPALLQAYADHADIHARTASLLLQIPQEMVSEEQRRQAKAINFGVIYGMSPFRLSKEQGIPLAQAQEFIEDYFKLFAGVQNFIDETVHRARRDSYVTTLYGHRRTIPELSEENRVLQARGERQAVNSVIQGSAADLMKRAMIRVEQSLAQTDLRAELLLQVHDELVIELHCDDLAAVSKIVKKEMEEVEQLAVPLIVEIGSAANWLQAH